MSCFGKEINCSFGTLFIKERGGRYASYCAECYTTTINKFKEKRKQDDAAYKRKLRAENPEFYRKKDRERNRGKQIVTQERRDRYNEKIRLDRKKNPEKYKNYESRKNKEKVSENSRMRRKRNKELFPEKFNNPKKKISSRMYRGIRRSLGEPSRLHNWNEYMDYTVDDLYSHLESKFTDGMCWERFAEIDIDHIIPVRYFNYQSEKDDEFKQCWALSNLQPLWSWHNRSKNDKLPDGTRASSLTKRTL